MTFLDKLPMRLTLAFLQLALAVQARMAKSEEPQTFCKAAVAQCHDGDTLLIDINLGFKIHHGWVICRAADFDSWELDRSRGQVEPFRSFTKSQWETEIERGKDAREALRKLLSTGQLYITPGDARDPYGRVKAKWYVYANDELVSVADYMKLHGHTRPVK